MNRAPITGSQSVQASVSAQPGATQAQESTAGAQNDLFSLDFHAPVSTPQQPPAPKKDVRDNILSLFSAPSPGTANGSAPTATLGQWGSTQLASQAQPQPISMLGANGVAMWGAQSGWTPNPPVAQPNVWAGSQGSSGSMASALSQQPSSQGLFETQNVWNAPNGAGGQAASGSNNLLGSSFGASSAHNAQKKDDIFGDLWGDFK